MRAGLPQERGETVAIATPAMQRRLATSTRNRSLVVSRRAKHLGIHFGPRAKRKDGQKAPSRLAANAAERARVTRLGKRLGPHMFASGLKPAWLYGASVSMPKSNIIAAMGRAAGRVSGKTKGRPRTARLAMNNCDPGWDAVRAPILASATGLQSRKVPT